MLAAGRWGVYRYQCSKGVCPRVLCRIHCFSPQLCFCPQVSSCLSACYDVFALVRCLSWRMFTPTLFPLVSTCVSRCTCRGSLPQLPCPLSLIALPESWTPPFLTGPCCWVLGCYSDGCQVPEADSQRWGCRLHPRGKLRGASHCVEKWMLL